MARGDDRAPVRYRVLAFVVVLGLSLGSAVLAAHQEQFDAGFGIAMLALIALGGVLWFVAWRRRAWYLRGGNGLLGLTLAGLVAAGPAAATAVSDVLLSTRGERVDVVVTQVYADDESRLYTLTPTAGAPPVRGDLNTSQDFDDGQTVTVLVDRGGFVRPALPEDLDAVAFVIITLAGIGVLAGTIIGAGFPLDARQEDE